MQQIPIFYDRNQTVAENVARLEGYYDWIVNTDDTLTETYIRSLYHECFMDIVRAFGDKLIETGRSDVYHMILNDFLLRASTSMTTEDAATEFASIRRLHSKTQNSLTDTVYPTNQTADFVSAFRSEYNKPQTFPFYT
jgi:hypothetical protein